MSRNKPSPLVKPVGIFYSPSASFAQNFPLNGSGEAYSYNTGLVRTFCKGA